MAYNRFRLSRDVYDREDDSIKIPPAKIIFLSVEGNVTEKEYFECISYFRNKLGINSRITVEVLDRADTNSAPKHVIELLEEYIELRDTSEEIEASDLPEEFRNKHSTEEIECYLNGSMNEEQQMELSKELKHLGLDISYRKFLEKYQGEDDEFGIVIDRDQYSHTKQAMKDCINHCARKNYLCYISNPCFEFWLLLHVCDVKNELASNLDDIKTNKKTNNMTYVSRTLNSRTHHGKHIKNFETNYLNNISLAVERAKEFACSETELIDNIGSNIWKLIEKLLDYKE